MKNKKKIELHFFSELFCLFRIRDGGATTRTREESSGSEIYGRYCPRL